MHSFYLILSSVCFFPYINSHHLSIRQVYVHYETKQKKNTNPPKCVHYPHFSTLLIAFRNLFLDFSIYLTGPVARPSLEPINISAIGSHASSCLRADMSKRNEYYSSEFMCCAGMA